MHCGDRIQLYICKEARRAGFFRANTAGGEEAGPAPPTCNGEEGGKAGKRKRKSVCLYPGICLCQYLRRENKPGLWTQVEQTGLLLKLKKVPSVKKQVRVKGHEITSTSG